MSNYIDNPYKKSVSNIFILISVLFTVIVYIFPDFYKFGMNDYFLNNWKYYIYFLQFFTSNFIHGWIFHLFFNWIFIYYFWNQVELILWAKKYVIFFIFNAIFVWIWLTMIEAGNTVWISWFALAILSYYTLELKDKKIDEYKWWITAIIVNIAIWFYPWVSLFWHLFWVIAGIIFYYLNKNFIKRVMASI
jgi:membrane associated rhomboid family serine protease